MKIHDILEALRLPDHAQDEQTLQKLKNWCETNISHDLMFEGPLDVQYQQYADVAATYRTLTDLVQTNIATPFAQLNQMNAIQFAATRGFDNYLESLTLTDTEINIITPIGRLTPLHLAANAGHVRAAIICLNKGANVKALDNQDNYPAMKCLMLTLSSRDRASRTALFEQLRFPELLTHRNHAGETVFHLAAQFGFTSLLENLMTDHPEGLFEANNAHQFPIQLAIRQIGESKETLLLLLRNPDVMRTPCPITNEVPLHDAARYITEDTQLTEAVVTASLAASVPLDVRNASGETPLTLAIKSMNRTMIDTFLAHGINLTKTDIRYAYHNTYENLSFCEFLLTKAPHLDTHILDELKAHSHSSP